MEPIKEQTEIADIETSSAEYAGRFSGVAGQWMLEVQEKLFLDLLPGNGKGSALDVGGGHGQTAIPLMHAGWQVTVAASAPQCIVRLQPHVAMARMVFRSCDLLNMPFSDAGFDLVVSIRFLSHCSRWKNLVSELCRLSRDMVIIDYPAVRSLNFFSPLLFRMKRKIEGNTRKYTLFRHKDVDSEFYRNGYKLASRKPQFFLPMVVHRMLKNRTASRALEFIFRKSGLCAVMGSPVLASYRKIQ